MLGAIEGKHPAQAPAHQTYFFSGDVVQVADFLGQRRGELAAESHIAAQAPGVYVVTFFLQKGFEHKECGIGRHEARDQKHRVAITRWRVQQQRQCQGQRGKLGQGAGFHQRVDGLRRAFVLVADNVAATWHAV